MASNDYALSCYDERGLVLSNWRSLELWTALERLVSILLRDSDFSNMDSLYAWKHGHHQALAKEPYAWRAVIEEIKSSDLAVRCAEVQSVEDASVMSDKPTMLKIAGEITNSLMHSYTARHKLDFVQRTSNVPFRFAL